MLSRSSTLIRVDQVSVLIADDDAFVRRALRVFLEADGLEVVGEAADGAEAVRLAHRLRPNVALVDVQMPGVDGIAATERITTGVSGTRVLAITTFGTIDTITPMLRAGASGYLLKDAEPDDIVTAVKDVHAGDSALSPRVISRLIENIRASPSRPHAPLRDSETLSSRELEIVEALGRGLSNAEIAFKMHLSVGTVKSHLSHIFTKWGARDRVQVLIRASRAGLIDLS